MQTVIIRHRKENLKKCSLRGLECRDDMCFIRYPFHSSLPDLRGFILLTIDAPPLLSDDADHGLLLIDGTWRYAEVMERQTRSAVPDLILRSLPGHLMTAYPRRQDDCSDPERGLASVEALFTAYRILGWPTNGLLDHYHWKQDFLMKNKFVST